MSKQVTVKGLLERAVNSLRLADHLGDVRDAENIWLYPAIDLLFGEGTAKAMFGDEAGD